MKKTFLKFLLCISLLLILPACGKSLETTPRDYEVFKINIPNDWKNISQEMSQDDIVAWESPDGEAYIVYWTSEHYYNGRKGDIEPDHFVRLLFKKDYSQREYGIKSYSGTAQYKVSGFETVEIEKLNGLYDEKIWDIDELDYDAVHANKYDEGVRKCRLLVVMFTVTNGENNKLYHNTFDKIAKSISVDFEKYKDYQH